MKPDYVDINPKTGRVEHIKWPCDCEWDADAGQIICAAHRADPEARG